MAKMVVWADGVTLLLLLITSCHWRLRPTRFPAGYVAIRPRKFIVAQLAGVIQQISGLSIGMYAVFVNLSLGVANPALGLVAGRARLDSVFLVSALGMLGSAAIALRLAAADSAPGAARA